MGSVVSTVVTKIQKAALLSNGSVRKGTTRKGKTKLSKIKQKTPTPEDVREKREKRKDKYS